MIRTNQSREIPSAALTGLRLVTAAGIAVMLGAGPVCGAESEPGSKRLVVDVVQGWGAEHDIRAPRPVNITVRVTDPGGKPVREAVVVFQSPAAGPGGGFAGGVRFATAMTNEQGLATAQGFLPNASPGEYSIAVTASFRDFQTANVAVLQRNLDPAAVTRPGAQQVRTKKGRGKMVAIIAAIGGAAAGLALSLAGGGDSPGPTPPPAGPATVIRPGDSTFGPPR